MKAFFKRNFSLSDLFVFPICMIFLYPFYYINYTLTTMGAMEFKKKYAENRESAWKDYLALTDVGGSKSYLEILRLAHLSVPFEAGAVSRSAGYAMKILEKQL